MQGFLGNRWVVAALGVAAFGALLAWRLVGQQPDTAISKSPTPAEPASRVAKSEPTPPPAIADTPPDAADAGKAPDAEGPVRISDEASLQAMLMSMYIELEGPLREWAETRGLPRSDPSGNYMLEQPYQQYDDETLAALAANGDMWAQQILADRYAAERPAEAMELYRQAAAGGSVFAMLKLAEISERAARLSPDFKFEDEGGALEQYYSLRDATVPPDVNAYAWRAVAEMAGLPGIMNMRGPRLAPEKLADACALAGSLYGDLLDRRASRGLGGYPDDAPPAWIDASALGHGSACEHDAAVRYDFSSCREIQVMPEGESEYASVFVCDGR